MRRLIASWFGSGLLLRKVRGSDAGSGTVGSAVALVLALALAPFGWAVQMAVAVAVTAMSVWATAPFAADGADPGWVVVDEAAGTFVATIGLGGTAAVVAWAVFRVADITKDPFCGVRAAEDLPGGWGITADDLAAGVYGLAAGWLVQALVG